MDMRIAWLAAGTFTTSSVGFVFAGLLSPVAAEMEIGIATAGYMLTSYALAYAIGAPVLSALFGAIDRRHLLTAAMLAFVLGGFVAAASSSFAMLIAAQMMLGAAAGLFVSTAQATAVALSGAVQRARAISIVFAGTSLAVAFGAPLGSLIASTFDWRATFVAAAILGLACALVLWLRLPRGLAGTRLTLNERLAAVGRPGIASSLLVTLIYLAGGFVIVAYLDPIGRAGAGLSEIAVPAMLLSFGIGAVAGNLVAGYLADRFGATRLVALALILSVIVSLAMAAGMKLLPPDLAGPMLIGILLPWGVIGWAFNPAQGSRIAGFAPEAAHLTLSLNVSALYAGIALGTIAGGLVLDVAAPSDLPLVAAVFPLAALAVLALSTRSRAAAARART